MKFNTLEKSFEELRNQEMEEALDDFVKSFNEDKMIHDMKNGFIDDGSKFEDLWEDDRIRSNEFDGPGIFEEQWRDDYLENRFAQEQYDAMTPEDFETQMELWYDLDLAPKGDLV